MLGLCGWWVCVDFAMIDLLVCPCVWVCLCASKEEEDDEGEKMPALVLQMEKREKQKGEKCEINKTLVCKVTVTVHICKVTVTMHICTILQALMWVFFWLKCVKLITFFILHNFATSDAVALKCVMAYGSGFFFFFLLSTIPTRMLLFFFP